MSEVVTTTQLNEAIELLCQLIAIPSVSGQERAVVEYLAGVFDTLGWPYELQDAAPQRPMIFVRFGTPHLLFSTHTDVVPGNEALFSPKVTDGIVYGRGACDAKGIIVAMITAARLLRDQGASDFGLLFVPGEELDGVGARAAAQAYKNEGIRYLVNGEPTEGCLMRGHKGALKVRLVAEGKACHSGYPQLGDDANRRLVAALHEISALTFAEHPILGATDCNFGLLDGGVAANVISPRAKSLLYVRTTDNSREVLAALRRVARSHRVEVEVLEDSPCAVLKTVPGFPLSQASYFTDIPRFNGLGAEPLLFGPGSIHHAHTINEHLSIQDFVEGVKGYTALYAILSGEQVEASTSKA